MAARTALWYHGTVARWCTLPWLSYSRLFTSWVALRCWYADTDTHMAESCHQRILHCDWRPLLTYRRLEACCLQSRLESKAAESRVRWGSAGHQATAGQREPLQPGLHSVQQLTHAAVVGAAVAKEDVGRPWLIRLLAIAGCSQTCQRMVGASGTAAPSMQQPRAPCQIGTTWRAPQRGRRQSRAPRTAWRCASGALGSDGRSNTDH